MEFTFHGDHIALDLVGTMAHWDTAEVIDRLPTPDDLVAWIAAAGLVDSVPSADATDLAEAVLLREAIYRIAAATMRGGKISKTDRDTLNAAAAHPPVLLELRSGSIVGRSGDIAAVLATIARAAIELFGTPAAQSIKQCARAGCTRLYLDQSRRGSRRWCDMRVCGNRAKAAAYRARHPESAR